MEPPVLKTELTPNQPSSRAAGVALAVALLGIPTSLLLGTALGGVGFLLAGCLFLLTPATAILLGQKARDDIDASYGRIGGRGMAQTAIVIGWIEVILIILVPILLIAGFLRLSADYLG